MKIALGKPKKNSTFSGWDTKKGGVKGWPLSQKKLCIKEKIQFSKFILLMQVIDNHIFLLVRTI